MTMGQGLARGAGHEPERVLDGRDADELVEAMLTDDDGNEASDIDEDERDSDEDDEEVGGMRDAAPPAAVQEAEGPRGADADAPLAHAVLRAEMARRNYRVLNLRGQLGGLCAPASTAAGVVQGTCLGALLLMWRREPDVAGHSRRHVARGARATPPDILLVTAS